MSRTRTTYTRLWSNRAFRALLLAHFCSNFGDWLAFIALFNLAALEWHTDIRGIASMTVAYLLPFALVAPFAGVYVDRWELRRLMIASDVLRAGLVLLMTLTTQLSHLCVLIFLHQTVSTFFNPAQQTAIPRLVGRDDILPANALATQASHLTKVLGPGIAGVLVATLGTRGCLLLDAATFVVSGIVLFFLPALKPQSRSRQQSSVATDMQAAWQGFLERRRLQWSLVSLVFAIGGLGAFLVALPIHARDSLGFGPRGMGLLLSTLGAGTLLGATVLIAPLAHRDRLTMMMLGNVLLALGLVGLVSVSNVFGSVVCVLFVGIGTAVLIVPAHAVFQEETADQHLGRVLSMALAIVALAQVSGMGLAAALGRTHPASFALALAAALCGFAAFLLACAQRLVDLRAPQRTPVTRKADRVIHAGDRG